MASIPYSDKLNRWASYKRAKLIAAGMPAHFAHILATDQLRKRQRRKAR